MSTGMQYKGEMLIGRSNYIEWLTSANLFFEVTGYMPYIDGSEEEPEKDLYYKTTSGTDKEGNSTKKEVPYSQDLAARYAEKYAEFYRNDRKALGVIKSTISLDNCERFKNKKNASDLYDAIKDTFGQSSLELVGRHLDKIIEANYNSFNTMDEYTSQIQSSAIYLKELKFEVPRPFLAWILFKGLPTSFDSFASRKYEALTKDLKSINIDSLISDLIAEESRMNSNSGLEANKAIKSKKTKKQAYCKHCNKKGHLEERCFVKYPELRTSKKDATNRARNKAGSNKAVMSAMTTISVDPTISVDSITNAAIKPNYKVILDSGATEHYTPIKEWLIDYKEISNKSIFVLLLLFLLTCCISRGLCSTASA
jgi:hypothetical protein